jgi:GxxExxY protein
MNTDAIPPNRLTERIIGYAMTVSNALGAGFVERVYENALAHELRKAGITFRQQHGITVIYDGIIAGEFVIDMLIEDSVLVELKSLKAANDIHRAQCMNYLRATGLRLCLLLNFGNPRLEIKRIVL